MVGVGSVVVGGNHPVRIQSMTTTDTLDVEATARQTIELAEAGCEIVRITAPNVRAAQALGHIASEIRKAKVDVPLVADIHFMPNAAMEAAIWQKAAELPNAEARSGDDEAEEHSHEELQPDESIVEVI